MAGNELKAISRIPTIQTWLGYFLVTSLRALLLSHQFSSLLSFLLPFVFFSVCRRVTEVEKEMAKWSEEEFELARTNFEHSCSALDKLIKCLHKISDSFKGASLISLKRFLIFHVIIIIIIISKVNLSFFQFPFLFSRFALFSFCNEKSFEQCRCGR